MPEITLRFVASDTITSRLIAFQAGISMPFTPSHVEALSRDEKAYTGMHIAGGCLARPIGYDKDEPNIKEAFVKLLVTEEQHDAFHAYVESMIGQPYDWKAILSFADPVENLHDFGHLICSAFMTLALRREPDAVFPWPLTVPAHRVSPRDLFLILSTHVRIDH